MTSATIPDGESLHEVRACGFVPASNGSARPQPSEVPADGAGRSVVRARETTRNVSRGESVR